MVTGTKSVPEKRTLAQTPMDFQIPGPGNSPGIDTFVKFPHNTIEQRRSFDGAGWYRLVGVFFCCFGGDMLGVEKLLSGKVRKESQ